MEQRYTIKKGHKYCKIIDNKDGNVVASYIKDYARALEIQNDLIYNQSEHNMQRTLDWIKENENKKEMK